jgi:DNA-binding protein
MTVGKDNIEFSMSQMHRILRKNNEGVEKRVSHKAAEQLGVILTVIADMVAKQAMELCDHAERRTIIEDDIKLATKNVLGRVLPSSYYS